MRSLSGFFAGVILLLSAFGVEAQTGDISVTKTALEGAYTPGQSVTYTIQVENFGLGL